jgi:hypothetical protein
MTGKEMCEYIVETFPELEMTWEQVWRLSPRGELIHVFDLFMAARVKNGWKYDLNGAGDITWIPPEDQ